MIEVGTQIGPRAASVRHTGMGSYGKFVPFYRRAAGLKHFVEMTLHSTERATLCIDQMCGAIERDQPYDALKIAMEQLDLTGSYRLLAVLLCAESDEPRVAEAPATFLDLVVES